MKKTAIAFLVFYLTACSEQTSTDHLAEAKAHLLAEKPQVAIISLKNAISESPELAEARFLLGQIYFDLKQFENAEKEFERAFTFNYSKKDLLPLLAKVYYLNESDNALVALSVEPDKTSKDKNTPQQILTPEELVEIKYYQLRASLRLAKEAQAKALIDEIKKLNTTSEFTSLTLANAAILEKNYYHAKVVLKTLLAEQPIQADGLKLLANIQLNEQDLTGAADTYQRYIEAYPDDVNVTFIFARLLTDLGRTEEAEPLVDNLLSINAEHGLLNQLKGLARYYQDDFNLALTHLEKSLLNAPKDVGTRLVAGVSAYWLEDYDRAHHHLSLIADQLPPSHPSLRLLAVSQLELGLTLDANNTVENFDNITSQDTVLLTRLGLSLSQAGEKLKAKALLDKTQSVNGDKANVLPELGLLKLSLNDISGLDDIEQSLV